MTTDLTEAQTYTTETHRAVVGADGFLAVYPTSTRTLTETTYTQGGVSVYHAKAGDNTPAGQLAAVMERFPLFAGTVDEDDLTTWHVDIDCGFQRWAGCQTNRQVRAALRKCGFEKADIDAMVKRCRAHPWRYCPRQG